MQGMSSSRAIGIIQTSNSEFFPIIYCSGYCLASQSAYMPDSLHQKSFSALGMPDIALML